MNFIQMLKSIRNRVGIILERDTVKSINEKLITSISEHEENVYEKVVVLIDEYDLPVLSDKGIAKFLVIGDTMIAQLSL
ncbi:uncharacterized protein OCT59_022882 [Rhizophagus irregularis]|uniref:AAA-ATPase-like domain-containing protein n=1 Tax=Rhizophagus irregularis (strain DAOM 197198w) TaxID=1432141 RepID=A0A015L7L4_RHIIW|nr:hypothetical protein RirG_267330 [Rhizophagus irregularis DAOM 197198w]UZO29405.1 hypothetical protein OCT59_022882 [Rhizophagus irregularis]GBC35420.1 hypothetical protein RIR_jg36709.t1 [Rhizophagus irregularis DAOM 181602=DAOM 197198]